MPHRSTIFRRELKLKDPEKYERMLDERRKKDKKQRAEMKRKMKEGKKRFSACLELFNFLFY